MIISEILAGVAGKLVGLGMAAKAGVGVGVATASLAAAGATGVVAVPGMDSSSERPAAEAQVPHVPTADAQFGLQAANDAAGQGAAIAGKPEATGLDRAAQTPAAAHLPSRAGKPEITGLDRAAQTPAAAHLPSRAGKPADVPTGAASAPGRVPRTDMIGHTPAAAHVPSVVPTAPANVPTVTSEKSGTDIVGQAPGAGRSPR